MDLLSSSDWLEIRAAIGDVTDTFLKLPVTYIRRTDRLLSKFHEERSKDLQQNVYMLLCLDVPENTDRTYSQVFQVKEGFMDVSEGYLLFSYPDLLAFTPSMIDSNGNSVFVPNKDSFIVKGREYTVIGVNLVGPTELDYQLVKVHYKKQLCNSKFAPINTVLPLITGTPEEGQLLSVTTGTWTTNAGALTYTYQWKRNNVNIALATENTYTLVADDISTIITCLVTATNTIGSIFVVSEGIPILPAP